MRVRDDDKSALGVDLEKNSIFLKQKKNGTRVRSVNLLSLKVFPKSRFKALWSQKKAHPVPNGQFVPYHAWIAPAFILAMLLR